MESAVNPIRMVLNGGYPPGTEGNPDALRHAALRQAFSRTTRSPPSSPTSAPPGAIAARRSARARPTSCAPHRWIEAAMINSDPPTSPSRRTTRPSSGSSPARTARRARRWPASPRPASSRSGLPSICSSSCRAERCNERSRTTHHHGSARSRPASSGAGRPSRSIIVVVLALLAAFAGIHQATMPQAARRDHRSDARCISPANSSRAISAACWSPTAR